MSTHVIDQRQPYEDQWLPFWSIALRLSPLPDSVTALYALRRLNTSATTVTFAGSPAGRFSVFATTRRPPDDEMGIREFECPRACERDFIVRIKRDKGPRCPCSALWLARRRSAETLARARLRPSTTRAKKMADAPVSQPPTSRAGKSVTFHTALWSVGR
jgi:hypothetical protein